MKNTKLTRRTRGAASLKIIAVIYGGKRRSPAFKRERVFKVRARQWLSGGRSCGRTRVNRDLDRSSSFLPAYRSHAAMSNVVKIPLLHPINYLRFPQLVFRRSRFLRREIADGIIGYPRAENRHRFAISALCHFANRESHEKTFRGIFKKKFYYYSIQNRPMLHGSEETKRKCPLLLCFFVKRERSTVSLASFSNTPRLR